MTETWKKKKKKTPTPHSPLLVQRSAHLSTYLSKWTRLQLTAMPSMSQLTFPSWEILSISGGCGCDSTHSSPPDSCSSSCPAYAASSSPWPRSASLWWHGVDSSIACGPSRWPPRYNSRRRRHCRRCAPRSHGIDTIRTAWEDFGTWWWLCRIIGGWFVPWFLMNSSVLARASVFGKWASTNWRVSPAVTSACQRGQELLVGGL